MCDKEQFEKVREGLGCHSDAFIEEPDCEHCQYDSANCGLEVPSDALSLIRQQAEKIHELQTKVHELQTVQTARVMTLEEACVQDVCWLEWRKRGRKPVACRVIMRKDYAGQPLPYVYRFFEEPTGYSKKNYGKDWRCWTQRPTDEQRKAVKWDG